MTLEPHAGRCSTGQRHAWAKKETRLQSGIFSSLYAVRCTRCLRVKIIEYTARGNHVAGYTRHEDVT